MAIHRGIHLMKATVLKFVLVEVMTRQIILSFLWLKNGNEGA